jgi:hypothetical protein
VIRVFLAALLLAGCQKPVQPHADLPAYSDMGAAADAARVEFDKP